MYVLTDTHTRNRHTHTHTLDTHIYVFGNNVSFYPYEFHKFVFY